MINLNDFKENEHVNTLAEAVGHLYKGKIVQVYWGESGGIKKYADYDISQNKYIEGRVLWGRGDVFAVEVEFETNNKKYKKYVLFSAWAVTLVTEKTDDLDVTSIFSGKI
jgi:hypothetical protein